MPFLNWPKKRPLVIDHTKVGTGTHASVPVRCVIRDATLSSRLRPDGIDLAVTDSDGSTQLNYERVLYAADLHDRACWSWYSGDRAAYDATGNCVVVTWADYADIWCGKYDLTANTWSVLQCRYAAGGDDHNHGCVAFGSDRSVLTVPCAHNDTALSLYYSDGADSISGWTVATIDNTANKYFNYPHLFKTTDGKYHCFARRSPSANQGWRDLVAYTSTQTSAPYTTWSAAATIIDAATSIQDFTYHKLVFDAANDAVYAVGGLYPGSTGNHSQYAFKLTWNGSAWSAAKLDGTAISLPMTALNAGTLAYTEVGAEGPWILDVALDGSGNLFALFNTFPDADTDHRLWCVRTASNAFGARESIGGAIGGSVCPGTASNYYNGGGCFNPGDPNEVLFGNGAAGTFEMQRWTYSAGTWSKAEDLTSYAISGRKNLRPFWIRNAAAGLKALWLEGTYTGYSHPSFNTQFLTYPRRLKPVCDITVAVPNLSDAADRTLYLYGGYYGATDQASAPTAVYDAATLLVCHGRDVRDDPAKLRNEISGNNATKALASRPSTALSPLLSKSQTFGTTPTVTFNAADVNINSATGLTVYSLARLANTSADRAVADNVVDGTAAQYLCRVRQTSGLVYAAVIGIDALYGGNAPTLTMPTSGVHLVGLVHDGANTKVSAMLDGVLEQTASNANLATLKTSGTPTTPKWGTYNSAWAGDLEEHVIANVARSAGYLVTISNMLTSNATFFALGTETDNVAGGLGLVGAGLVGGNPLI